jgi:methionyl-tRNA formyltransferase
MKIGVLASGNLGAEILKGLYRIHEIDFVATDSKSNDILNFTTKNEIKTFKGNPRNGKAIQFIGNSYIEVLVSVNYLFLIEEDLILLPSKLAINIHGSLLPKYRGRTPHVWAIINGESKTGITVHQITKGCDEGKIINQLEIPIHKEMTGGELLSVYNAHYLSLIVKTLKIIELNDFKLIVQNEKAATYFGKRTPADGIINWNWSKERIINWVRAQAYPYPGAFTLYNQEKVIIDKVVGSNLGYHFDMENGTILNDNPLIVKTPNGALEILNMRGNVEFIKKEILK